MVAGSSGLRRGRPLLLIFNRLARAASIGFALATLRPRLRFGVGASASTAPAAGSEAATGSGAGASGVGAVFGRVGDQADDQGAQSIDRKFVDEGGKKRRGEHGEPPNQRGVYAVHCVSRGGGGKGEALRSRHD